MVAIYIELAYVIVKGDCKIGDKTRRHKTPDGLDVPNMPYARISNYRTYVVKVK